MTKREAKRWACFHASRILDAQLSVGWPDPEDWDAFEKKDFEEKDVHKLVGAVEELISELQRRGRLADE